MKLNNSKILITGSSGSIGNCLSEVLLKEQLNIIPVDIQENFWNKEINNKTIYLDLTNSEQLKKLPTDINIIVHFAANSRVYNLIKNPSLSRDNFLTVYNIMEFARKNNIRKVLFSSSREVYGNSDNIIFSEEKCNIKYCENPYSATKIAGESLITAYQQCYNIDYIILRFSNVYGRYDYSDRVIPLFISKALRNEDIVIYGSGKILDFTYIYDCVNGVIKALEQFETAKNEVYNIATQKGYSIEKVAQLIVELTNSKSKIYYAENRIGEVNRFIADISKANAVLDYKPEIDLRDGIVKTIEWYFPRIEEYRSILIKGKH